MAAALAGVDAVVHSAGLAHAMSGAPEDDYRTLNTEATRELARGRRARAGAPLRVPVLDPRAGRRRPRPAWSGRPTTRRPTDAYGRSKLEAERALAEIGLDWVALRPVLVYGAGVKGNMAALLRLARCRIPCRSAALAARRSLISLDSLSAAVDAVLRAPTRLRTEPWSPPIPDPLSRAGDDRGAARGPRPQPGLVPVPAGFLKLACRMAGREASRRIAEDWWPVPRPRGARWHPASATRTAGAARARRSTLSG